MFFENLCRLNAGVPARLSSVNRRARYSTGGVIGGRMERILTTERTEEDEILFDTFPFQDLIFLSVLSG